MPTLCLSSLLEPYLAGMLILSRTTSRTIPLPPMVRGVLVNIMNNITIRINRKFHPWQGEIPANPGCPTAGLQFGNLFNLLIEVS